VGPHGVALTLPAFIQSLGWSAQPEDRNGPADWAAILYYLAFPLGLAGLWAVSRREGRSSFWRESPGKSAGGRPAAGRDWCLIALILVTRGALDSPPVAVPVQYFQSVIALELAVTGALLWQMRYFEARDPNRPDEPHLPDARLRLGLAAV